jgi:hypothetical protein
VKYRLKDSSDPHVWKAAASNSKWLTTLTASTDYEFEVRSECPSTNSGWASEVYFSTLASKEMDELLEENGWMLSLFPNPARDFIFINYEMYSDEPAELNVLDVYGKTVINRHLDDPQGTLRLPVDKLPSGHFLIQIGNGQERIMKKFVVVN